jgi:transcriptional regulator with PAS, ATPase and Fis domain
MRGGDNKMGLIKCIIVFLNVKIFVHESLKRRLIMMKEMIRKALERHHGKRKNAANDLKISERTLYRKIKEYGLE